MNSYLLLLFMSSCEIIQLFLNVIVQKFVYQQIHKIHYYCYNKDQNYSRNKLVHWQTSTQLKSSSFETAWFRSWEAISSFYFNFCSSPRILSVNILTFAVVFSFLRQSYVEKQSKSISKGSKQTAAVPDSNSVLSAQIKD
ncbi:Hypothetical_protein [Hexamita inflata]|uniref:Hypothetical_protein n=1 Tax=Hexamita inflata TaxID=28002 RepID=A0AA86TNW9_9EUKA|nr:Hypothetical protein HINF_LOCUS10981 [Hexamita inflata]